MKKIIIIGDSFSVTLLDKNLKNWPNLLHKEFLSDYDIILDAESGRDPQTIIENYIKFLQYVGNDDVVILFLSSFMRARLPLHECDYTHIEKEEFKITNRFICPSYYGYTQKKLEIENLDWKYLNEKLSIQSWINNTNSNILNQIEILESLNKIKKTNIFIFSWDYINVKNNIIKDRKLITDELGFWETLVDLGVEHDFHWSEKTHQSFANYLIKEIKKLNEK